MRILFTGATGVIGGTAVPLLVGAGHDVRAVTRHGSDPRRLRDVGARPISVDLSNPEEVDGAVRGVDAIVHMATAIPAQHELTKRASWAANDRLRTEATGLLVDAALTRGVGRFVQQSISLLYADGGDHWIDEDSPTAPIWEVMDSALDGERHVARFGAGGGAGVTLRLSSLYGPGRASADYLTAVGQRKLPVVGDGQNFVSRLHVGDVATAIGAALAAPAGTYNVTDNRPTRVNDELHLLAELLGARTPRRVPRWLARAVVGPASRLLTVSHRISAQRFTDMTGWKPAVPDSGEGWTDAVAQLRNELQEAR